MMHILYPFLKPILFISAPIVLIVLLIAIYLKYSTPGVEQAPFGEIKREYTRGLKHFTVIINPCSGNKKARQCFNTIRPQLEEANIRMTIIETTHKGHAFRIANQVPQQDCDGIMCVGGDGLVHEVVNGLLSRADAGIARHIPIAIIPCGLKNSFAHSLGIYNPQDAVSRVIKGYSRPLDIISVTPGEAAQQGASHSPMHVLYGLQGLGWGLSSEMDALVDRLRWSGFARKYLAALTLLFTSFRLPHYSARVVFPPVQSPLLSTTCDLQRCANCELPMLADKGKRPSTDLKGMKVIDNGNTNSEDVNNEELLFVVASNGASPLSPYAHLSDGYIDLAIGTLSSTTSRMALVQMLVNMGEKECKGKIQHYKAAQMRLELERRVPLSLDGELLELPDGTGPMTLDVQVLRAQSLVIC